MENIKACREERQNIIDGFKKHNESMIQRSMALSQNSKSLDFYSSGFSQKSSSMDKDQRAIEKLKMRQKAEVENLIDQELKMEMMRKENEMKDYQAKVKEQQLRVALTYKQKWQEETKKQKEFMKQLQTEKEYHDLQRTLTMKHQQEQMKKEYLAEKQRMIAQEHMVRKQLQMQMTREKKMNSERVFLEQQRRTIEKQIMMDERAKWRKSMGEQIHNLKKFDNAKNEEYQKARTQQMKSLMEGKAIRLKQELEYKDFQVEQRKKFFETMHKASYDNLNNSMDNPMMPPRIADRNKEAKMKNDYHLMMKSQGVLTKLDQIDNHVLWKQQEREKNQMFKSELNALKREEFKNNLKKREKIQEYHREVNLRKLREKEERLAQIKQYKQVMSMEKKGVQEKNHQQKKQVMELFDRMVRNSNSISPEMILEMFPGEQALITKLMALKDVAKSSSPAGRSDVYENQWQSQSFNNSYQNSI